MRVANRTTRRVRGGSIESRVKRAVERSLRKTQGELQAVLERIERKTRELCGGGEMRKTGTLPAPSSASIEEARQRVLSGLGGRSPQQVATEIRSAAISISQLTGRNLPDVEELLRAEPMASSEFSVALQKASDNVMRRLLAGAA